MSNRSGRCNVGRLRLGDDLKLTTAKVVVPESGETVVTDFYGKPPVFATATRIYATYQLGGRPRRAVKGLSLTVSCGCQSRKEKIGRVRLSATEFGRRGR